MPSAPTYPGVYIEEIPSGVRTITGVATSIAAFIGYFNRGPMEEAVQILNWGDFEREFGGLDTRSEASYSIKQFFLNGGKEAWVIRTVAETSAAAAAIRLRDSGSGGTAILLATAISEGEWGNNLRIDVDYNTTDPATTFNLTVSELSVVDGKIQPGSTEVYRNLILDSTQSNDAVSVVNENSKLIQLELVGSAASIQRPAQTGTISDDLTTEVLSTGVTIDTAAVTAGYAIDVLLNSVTMGTVTLASAVPSTASALASTLQSWMRALDTALKNLTVKVLGTPDTQVFYQIKAGTSEASDVLTFAGALAVALGLDAPTRSNVQSYALGGGTIAAQESAGTEAISGNLTASVLGDLDATDSMEVFLDGASQGTVTLGLASPGTAALLASTLEDSFSATSLASATVSVLEKADSDILLIEPGSNGAVTFSGGLATKLGLTSAQPGDDGTEPDGSALIGSEAQKTGMYALLDVDVFNILCIPDTMRLTDTEAEAVAAEAITFCESQRAFYILDVPQADSTRDEVDDIKEWLDENSTLRHKNAALYYPRPQIADELNEYRLRLIASSGTLAGLYARTDSQRGVWKAPAGTEASLKGVQELEYLLTDAENGTLNPLAINCLRNFPVYGNICWGARTLDGSDQQASEWKYIPVRRLALFLEESLYRGTKWVVFEPNDEPLWAQIRLNIGAFLNNLFRQGAFQGQTPKEAYFVKCDKETTTQNDINLGIVNIVVGFAPLKPAEFVIIKLQQMAGQIEV